MSCGRICSCDKKDWEVIHYKHNHSTFETPKYGYHESEYSTVHCKNCGMVWHTRGKYVDKLPLCNSSGCITLGETN